MVYRLGVPFDEVLTDRGFPINETGQIFRQYFSGMETGNPEVVLGVGLNVARSSAAMRDHFVFSLTPAPFSKRAVHELYRIEFGWNPVQPRFASDQVGKVVG